MDLFGPGVSITSDYYSSDAATAVMSGTSMASPHATGAAALYLQLHPSATPAQVVQALITNATPNKVTDPGAGSPNRLLYTGFLNPGGNIWATKAGMPTARRHFAIGGGNGLIYTIGGVASGSSAVSTVQAYNPGSNTWSARAGLPAARESSDGAAVINDRLYVAGGHNATGTLVSTLYVYNPATNTWSTKASMPLASGCGVSRPISGKLYVLTGCTTSGAAAGLLHRYDPATNKWTALEAAPHAHLRPASGVINNKLYVVGGREVSSVSARLDVHTPRRTPGSRRPACPPPGRAPPRP